MTYTHPAPPTAPGSSSLAPPASASTGGLTIYGCAPAEVALFREVAARHGATPIITAAAPGEDTAEPAEGTRAISIGHQTPVTDRALRALSRAGVAYISTRSAGTNHLDVEYAASLGITVGTVAYSPDSVADYTVMLMLMALRGAKAMVRRTDTGDYRLSESRGRELRDLTVGVVGTGRIGSAVVDRLRGFGGRILACDQQPSVAAEYRELDELLAASDVVTLHTPLTAGTRRLLDRRRIAALPPGAVIVNTGRGALLDTAALADALEQGRLGGAALDVIEGEEGVFYADRRSRPIGDGPLARLQRLPNVVISPHSAYHTDHALRDMAEGSIANCLRFVAQHG